MWSNNYIGIPFKEKGRDRSGADCWGLVRLIYKEQYNIDLPSFVNEYPSVDDRDRIHELIAQYKEAWNPVTGPSEGSVVLFRILGSETHIGVALNEQEFVHVREGSDSVIERFDSAVWKNRLIGHFKYTTDRTAILNAAPHPLQTQRYTVPVPPGTTLDKLAEWIVKEWNVAPELKAKVTILVNGIVVPHEMWMVTVLKDTDQIEYRAVPTGGGTGRLFLMIAIAIAAPYIAGALTGYTSAAAAAAMMGTTVTTGLTVLNAAVTIGVSLLGSALVNAIFPVRPPPEAKDPGSSERQLMVTGGANQANPYGAIPLVLGRIKMTPPLGANNYITFTNERDSYLSMMLAWGYGPLYIDASTLKIGEVAFSDFDFAKFADGTNQVVTLDRQNDVQATIDRFNTIYGRDIYQVQRNIDLAFDANPETSTSSYQGTSTYDSDGNVSYATVLFSNAVSGNTVEATITSNDTGIASWSITTANMTSVVVTTVDTNTKKITGIASNSSAQINISIGGQYTASYSGYRYGAGTGGPWQEAATVGKCSSVTVALHFPQGLRKIKSKGDGAGDSYPTIVGVDMEYKIGSGAWTTWQHLNIGGDGYKKDAFTLTYTKSFDTEITSGVQVRLRRTTGARSEDNPDWRYYHQVVFLTAAFINNDSPAVDPKNCKIAKTAIKIKSNEQFNGQIQGINAIVQTYCLSYNGTTWANAATNNPADLFRYVLQHPANPQRILDSEVSEKINLTQLQYWWNYCNQTRSYTDPDTGITTSYKLTYNAVLAEARSVLDVLRDICAAGRASPAMIDGKWTVIIDEPRTSIIQHFTPHNSWGFEGTRALPKTPDALKIQYYDEDQDYQQVESIIYKAGKSQATAELFESISLPGITKREVVIDHARWHMAQAQLRRESYVLNTDIEYLVCNRGDRVKVTHDVPMWGISTGRIKNRISAKIFDLDEPTPISAGSNYTVRVRSNTGASIERTLQKSFTIAAIQRLANIVTITTTEEHPIKVGNKITIASSVSAINGTFIINAVTNTTISYEMIATNISYQAAGGTITLTDDYYTRIMVTTTTGATEVQAGDLFLFGLYQQESQDLVVLNIEPSNNKTARLTLVDYGVTSTYNIFTDYKTLTSATVFNTNISYAPTLNRELYTSTQKPQVTLLSSDESAADLSNPGIYTYRLRISFANTVTDLPSTTTSVECQYDLATATTGANYKSTIVDYLSGNVYVTGVLKNQSYKVRLRYVSSDGAAGPWTSWYSTTIAGKLIPPSTPTNFSYVLKETGIQFKWDPSTDVDYSSTVIKYITYTTATIPDNPTDEQKEVLWLNGTKIFEGNADTWVWTKPPTGNYYVMIKHLDTSGNYSLVHNAVSINYTNLILASLQIEFSNPVPVIPILANSTTPVLLNSGTQIRVLQGGTALKYDNAGTAAGRWKITTKTDSTGITSGAYNTTLTDATNGDDYATVANLTAFTAESTATVTFTITGKTTLGDSFTITKVLTYYTVKPSNTAAIVYAYKRSASAPADNPGAVTYSFTSAGITSPAALANNWSKVIVEGTDPLWVTTAAASSNTGTDEIAATEWSTPVKYSTNGLNTHIVRLYARNSSTTSAPTKATTGTSTYTFSTASVSGQPNGWSLAIPAESNGNVIWTIQATATSTSDSDDIANSEWSAPVVYGRQGDPGISSAVVYVYKRSASEPAADDKPGAITYSFATNQITTAEADMNGWKKQVYAGTDPLWVRAATAASNTATDTIANTEWSSAIKYVENGLNTASVFLYARNDSTSSAPTKATTGTATYTFSDGSITDQPTGWTRTIPDISGGTTIWVIQATAAGTGSTDTIDNTEWSTPVILNQQGPQGPRSAYGYVYYSVAQGTAPSKPTATNYDFDSGAFTELTTNWSTSINVGAVAENNANQKYWAAKFTVSEDKYGGTKTITFANPSVHLNLDGIVTFTNLANATDKTATAATIIDGGAIKTGTIDADRITADQLFLGHRLQDKETDPTFVINFKDKYISITA